MEPEKLARGQELAAGFLGDLDFDSTYPNAISTDRIRDTLSMMEHASSTSEMTVSVRALLDELPSGPAADADRPIFDSWRTQLSAYLDTLEEYTEMGTK